jgi:hypothetical protein
MFRNIFEVEIKDGYIPIPSLFQDQCRKKQNFLIEPNKFCGFIITPIIDQHSGFKPPKEVVQMDERGKIRAPKALINQLKEENKRLAFIVGCMDCFEIYTPKYLAKVQKMVANIIMPIPTHPSD